MIELNAGFSRKVGYLGARCSFLRLLPRLPRVMSCAVSITRVRLDGKPRSAGNLEGPLAERAEIAERKVRQLIEKLLFATYPFGVAVVTVSLPRWSIVSPGDTFLLLPVGAVWGLQGAGRGFGRTRELIPVRTLDVSVLLCTLVPWYVVVHTEFMENG